MRRALLLLLPALPVWIACGGDGEGVRQLPWRIELATAPAHPPVLVEAAIVQQCPASFEDPVPLYRVAVRNGESSGGMRPPALDLGTYGFAGRALDRSCRWFATGCTAVELGGSRSPSEVVVRLYEPSSGGPLPACAFDEVCVAGDCVPAFSDGGSPDGRLPTDGGGPGPGRDGEADAAACTGEPLVLVPSNVGLPVALGEATPLLDVGDGEDTWVADTDAGTITRYDGASGGEPLPASRYEFRSVQVQDGPDLGVFAVSALRVRAGARLVATGSRAFVLLVARDATIRGSLSVAAGAFTDLGEAPVSAYRPAGGGSGGRSGAAAQGAGAGVAGEEYGASDQVRITGSGGGGYGSAGGRGGSNGTEAEVPGGSTYGDASLVPLLGGSGGAIGACDAQGRGGDGGGALQLSAGGSLFVASGGAIDAGGGGGRIGSESCGGSGGGSGGGILLEAAEVRLEGHVAANGGGGSSGSALFPVLVGQDGADGRPDATAAGGREASSATGDGGDGSGSSDGQAGDGATARFAGGGGGGAGRIRVHTRTGTLEGMPTVLNPGEHTGLATRGRAAFRCP